MTRNTNIDIALEPHATIPLSVLKWWRELVALNPKDLGSRLDAQIARLEKSTKKDG